MSTSVASVTKFFPTAQNGFTTTLASTIASGAATVPLNSVAGYTNGDTAVFVIEPTSSTAKQTFTGVIDTAGVQVTGVVWTAGTNQTHTGGVTVVDYATATHMSMVTKGLLVAHTVDGTHKSGATYLLPTIASFANANHDHTNSAGGGALGTGAVSAAALATSAITLGYAQATSNFTSTTVGSFVDVTSLSVAVTVPAGGRRVRITFGTQFVSATMAAGNSLQTAIYDVTASAQIGGALVTTAGSSYGSTLSCVTSHVPAAGARTYKIQVEQGSAGTMTVAGSSAAPAFILVEAI